MKIFTYPYRGLRAVSMEMDKDMIDDFVRNGLHLAMESLMSVLKGVGISGPQIGMNLRIIVCNETTGGHFDPAKTLFMFNPEIVSSSSETIESMEGCLSIPTISAKVSRPKTVTVKYLNERAEMVQLDLAPPISIIVQHEIDHLNGILFIDRVDPVTKVILDAKLKKLNRFKREAGLA